VKKTKEKDERKIVKVSLTPDSVNEIVLIAAVVADERARKKYLNIPPDYFFGPSHAEMWAALQELYRRGLEYDTDAIRTIGGEKFDVTVLEEYVRSRPSVPQNLNHHVAALRWDKTRAEAARGVVPLFIDALRDPTSDHELVKSLATQVRDAFVGKGDLRYLRDSHSVVIEHSHDLTNRREGRGVHPFGIRDLDLYGPGDTKIVKKPDPNYSGKFVLEEIQLDGKHRCIPGCTPGYTTAIAGVSGSGKTTLTASVVLAQAEKGRKILWGAWEQMPGPSLEMVALLSLGFSFTDFRTGNFTKREQLELEQEMERLGEFVQFFELPFGRSRGEKGERFNDRNLDLIHQYVAEAQPHLFIADVFRYALHEQRPDEESMAIKRMNAIGKDTRSHIILINHLSLKEVERREDKRPTRDAVMGTSGWINDVDTVLAAHCQGLFKPVPRDKIEVHFLKQRYGDWGFAVELEYDPEYGYIGKGKTMALELTGERDDVDVFLEKEKGRRHGSGSGSRRSWSER
jgi:hypothetical protein